MNDIIFNAWVARQPDDSLFLFGNEPYWGEYGWYSERLNEKYDIIDWVELPIGAFPEVRRDTPMEVELVSDSDGNVLIKRLGK